MPSIPSKESRRSPEGHSLYTNKKVPMIPRLSELTAGPMAGLICHVKSKLLKAEPVMMHGMLHACPERRIRCSGLF